MAKLILIFVGALLMLTLPLHAAPAPLPITSFKKTPNSLLLTTTPGTLQLQLFSDSILRVTYSTAEIPQTKSLAVIAQPIAINWSLRETPESLFLETKSLRAKIDRQTSAITFSDLTGKILLQESPAGRDITPTTPPNITGNSVRQSFLLPPDEAIYGLGQHQQGFWNYRDHTVHLQQRNMEIGIPVLLSSKGYALLWDNPAVTDIAVGTPDAKDTLTWTSEVGPAIDYYFLAGPTPDDAIRNYRTLTGPAPLMPKYLWGFWQCKERYRTNDELLEVATKYRDMKVPIDGIIQDWRYWPDDTWGSHDFDKSRYPDPAATFKHLHDLNYHVLISVWPKFDLGTPNITELQAAHAMYDPVIPYVFPPGKGQWYDPFSPAGRQIYWKQVSTKLFSLGIDGWWLDAPEPELSGKWGEFRAFTTADGPGANVFNAYPLMHSAGIYQGQRAQTDEKRVVILTLAYAGQQRNSAISWSGDIGSSWSVLQHQIPAGLNFSASGIPYWNTDIGGFGGVRNPSLPAYAEIFSRWFQFGSFCPMFRVHGSAPSGGTGPGKEIWRFDQKTQNIWRTYTNLRYRLLPYIYSVSWQVTSNGSTMMRPLVMDFPDDSNVFNIPDQYLFGPAIMVNPVTTQGATTRSVYLPGKTDWYDFWTGKRQPPGKLEAPAPIETIPLYIRPGSILPMGPLVQYSNEKPADPIELRIYRGAAGAFTLYEDEGDSYRYEKGAYATIPLTWNDASQTLTIGPRTGSFPGMLATRTFHIVFVAENHGNAVTPTATPDQIIQYSGQRITVKSP